MKDQWLILLLKPRSGTCARLHDFLQQCPAAPGGEQMAGRRLWGSRLAGSVKNKAAKGLQRVCEPGAALKDSEVGRKGREARRYPALGRERGLLCCGDKSEGASRVELSYAP